MPYFGKLIEVERRRWFRPIQFAEVYYHRVLGARFVSGERQVSSELKAALDRFVAKIDSKEPWIDRIAIPSAIVVKK